MGKSGKGQSDEGGGAKAAAKELARLEKHLDKARGVEAKRRSQASEAAKAVKELEVRIKALRPAPSRKPASRTTRPIAARSKAATAPAAAAPKPAAPKPAAAPASRRARGATPKPSTATRPAAAKTRSTVNKSMHLGGSNPK